MAKLNKLQKDILKRAGVKSTKELYEKYPTEEAFILATGGNLPAYQPGGPFAPADATATNINIPQGLATTPEEIAAQEQAAENRAILDFVQSQGPQPGTLEAPMFDPIDILTGAAGARLAATTGARQAAAKTAAKATADNAKKLQRMKDFTVGKTDDELLARSKDLLKEIDGLIAEGSSKNRDRLDNLFQKLEVNDDAIKRSQTKFADDLHAKNEKFAADLAAKNQKFLDDLEEKIRKSTPKVTPLDPLVTRPTPVAIKDAKLTQETINDFLSKGKLNKDIIDDETIKNFLGQGFTKQTGGLLPQYQMGNFLTGQNLFGQGQQSAGIQDQGVQQQQQVNPEALANQPGFTNYNTAVDVQQADASQNVFVEDTGAGGAVSGTVTGVASSTPFGAVVQPAQQLAATPEQLTAGSSNENVRIAGENVSSAMSPSAHIGDTATQTQRFLTSTGKQQIDPETGERIGAEASSPLGKAGTHLYSNVTGNELNTPGSFKQLGIFGENGGPIPSYNVGGPMLREFNGQDHGGPEGGIPVDGNGTPAVLSGKAATALVSGGGDNKETVFTDPSYADGGQHGGQHYIFSDAHEEKFASRSRKILDRMKKRPNDKATQESALAELRDLRTEQEAIRSLQQLDQEVSFAEMGGLLPEFAKGGGIHIDPSKRGTFKAIATRLGMGVQQAASHILANKDKFSKKAIKKANFAKNFAKEYGGGLTEYNHGGPHGVYNPNYVPDNPVPFPLTDTAINTNPASPSTQDQLSRAQTMMDELNPQIADLQSQVDALNQPTTASTQPATLGQQPSGFDRGLNYTSNVGEPFRFDPLSPTVGTNRLASTQNDGTATPRGDETLATFSTDRTNQEKALAALGIGAQILPSAIALRNMPDFKPDTTPVPTSRLVDFTRSREAASRAADRSFGAAEMAARTGGGSRQDVQRRLQSLATAKAGAVGGQQAQSLQAEELANTQAINQDMLRIFQEGIRRSEAQEQAEAARFNTATQLGQNIGTMAAVGTSDELKRRAQDRQNEQMMAALVSRNPDFTIVQNPDGTSSIVRKTS
jgi:hypothetical protein